MYSIWEMKHEKREGSRAGSWWVSPALSILKVEEGHPSHSTVIG
jgi:hypothetical protein